MFLIDLHDQALWLNGIIFLIAAAWVWISGTLLTTFADVIAERTGIGRAFVGLLLLGGATSLPEIATTATAAAAGNAVLAGNNLLGGVAMQVAVLAAVDAVVMRRSALTFVTPRPVLLIQGVLLVLLITATIAAIAAGEILSLGTIGLGSILLAGFYLLGLFVIQRYEGNPRWEPIGEVEEEPQAAVDLKDVQHRKYADTSSRQLWLRFAASSLGVLVGGYIVARTGDVLAVQTGLGSSFVGATLLALATSLPEVSTTSSAVRIGAYGMAVANILGTNALEIALFFVADLFYREGPILLALDRSAIFLAALGIAMTCLYLWGFLERRDRTVLGMGVDSAAVLALYAGGMAVLYLIR